MSSRASGQASRAQQQAAESGIGEQRRQFDAIQELLKPYVSAGQPALQQQQALLGLGGTQAQQQAITGIEQSPLFQAQARQGEEALLQRASATGGLRGGNVQAALAQFRPAMLQQAIDTQYSRLGGLATLGQRSAAGLGDVGMQTGTNVANLMSSQGAAQAAGSLAQGRAFGQTLGGLSNVAGQYFGQQAAQPTAPGGAAQQFGFSPNIEFGAPQQIGFGG
jgi:hypothetical protein